MDISRNLIKWIGQPEEHFNWNDSKSTTFYFSSFHSSLEIFQYTYQVLYDINSTCDLLEVASFEGWEGTKAGVLSNDVALSIGLRPSNSACQKISNQ
jgi:hypothetical protein